MRRFRTSILSISKELISQNIMFSLLRNQKDCFLFEEMRGICMVRYMQVQSSMTTKEKENNIYRKGYFIYNI